MKYLVAGVDLSTQFICLVVEFALRMVAAVSTVAMLVGLIVVGGDLVPGSWIIVWPLVLAVGLESNLIVLLVDALLERIPTVWMGEEAQAWRRLNRLSRLAVIAMLGVAVMASLIVIGPDWSPVLQVILMSVRSFVALIVVVFNVVLSPLVRYRVAAVLAREQAASLRQRRGSVRELR